MSRAVPPRAAQRLLLRALPEDAGEAIVGDLDEVFRRRVEGYGAVRAWLWYWREALSFAGRFLRERVRPGPDRDPGRVGGPRRRVRWAFSWLDVKLGGRMLAKSPGLTAVGVLGMAVAIALATSWWQFSRNLIDPRMDLDDADRIVRIRNWDVSGGGPDPRSLHDYELWRREVRTIEHLSAAAPGEFRLRTPDGRVVSAVGARLSPSTFPALRVRPLLGRTLLEEDAEAGAPPVIVIGHDLWQRLFDGDPGIVGRDVRVGTGTATLIGVMPEGFGFPTNQEVWVPFGESALDYARREGPALIVFGRLAPGVSLEESQAELTALGQRAAADFPLTNENLQPRVTPFAKFQGFEVIVAGVANLVFVLLLFVMCANVGTLVFARTVTRENEIALRTALGASRARIVVQLFTEALVLTTLAAAIGLLVAARGLEWGMALFWEVQQARPPFWIDTSVSASTAMYVAALALFGAAVIGILPALKATGQRLRSRLATPGAGGETLRFGAVSTAVIVVQVALCVALVPLAVLRGQELLPDREAGELFPAAAFLSGRLLRDADPGAGASAGPAAGTTSDHRQDLRRRLEAEGGIVAVTFSDRLPGMNHPTEAFRIDAGAGIADSLSGRVRTLAVDPDFFDTMGARIVAGRGLLPSDAESGVDVLVIGSGFAESVLGGRNAVGRLLQYPERRDEEGKRWYEIVGVVEDPPIVRFGAGAYVGVYRPLQPRAQAVAQVYARTSAAPHSLVPRMHDLVESVGADLVVDELMTLEETWHPVRRADRFFVIALAVVSGMALLLSLAGIYALMSFTVAQRVREIAIRAALGAHPRRILLAIFSRALMQIGAGVLAGGLLISLVVIDDAKGARIVAGVAALVLTIGLMACAVPALRALRIEPADALREG